MFVFSLKNAWRAGSVRSYVDANKEYPIKVIILLYIEHPAVTEMISCGAE